LDIFLAFPFSLGPMIVSEITFVQQTFGCVVASVVTDNASNMVGVRRFLIEEQLKGPSCDTLLIEERLLSTFVDPLVF